MTHHSLLSPVYLIKPCPVYEAYTGTSYNGRPVYGDLLIFVRDENNKLLVFRFVHKSQTAFLARALCCIGDLIKVRMDNCSVMGLNINNVGERNRKLGHK